MTATSSAPARPPSQCHQRGAGPARSRRSPRAAAPVASASATSALSPTTLLTAAATSTEPRLCDSRPFRNACSETPAPVTNVSASATASGGARS
jgi:hypothetical protein